MSVWVLGSPGPVQPNGKAVNQAFAAERMGAPTQLVASRDALSDADMTGGLVFLAQLETSTDDIAAFFATAAAQQGRKIVHMAPMTAEAKTLFDLSDMAIFGQAELAAFLQLDNEPSNIDDLLPIQPLLTRHNQAAVVILNGIGTVAVWADRTMLVDSFTLDPISAGLPADCICGTIAAAVAQGIGPDRAMTLACAAASLAIQDILPSRTEIEAVIDTAGR
jgi:sugar/nucleoside kinase (ribokinase family)